MGDVATIPLFLNRKVQKEAETKIVFLTAPEEYAMHSTGQAAQEDFLSPLSAITELV